MFWNKIKTHKQLQRMPVLNRQHKTCINFLKKSLFQASSFKCVEDSSIHSVLNETKYIRQFPLSPFWYNVNVLNLLSVCLLLELVEGFYPENLCTFVSSKSAFFWTFCVFWRLESAESFNTYTWRAPFKSHTKRHTEQYLTVAVLKFCPTILQ